MTAEADTPETAPAKGSKRPLLIGLVLAIAGATGGYFAVSLGVVGPSGAADEAAEVAAEKSAPDVMFVALDPLIISLPGANGRDHLRFAAQLDVKPEYAAEVEAVKPRIVDVLNGYLRAVEVSDLEDPSALTRLRSQMLRRIQVVTGPGRVNDLLIMEFVLS